MKFYGTARFISYYDSEIGGSNGTAADLVFYACASPAGSGSVEWAGMNNHTKE